MRLWFLEQKFCPLCWHHEGSSRLEGFSGSLNKEEKMQQTMVEMAKGEIIKTPVLPFVFDVLDAPANCGP